MTFKTARVAFLISCLILLAIADWGTANVAGFSGGEVESQNAEGVQFVNAEELQMRLARNQAVTIIDVRGSSSLAPDESKIKGAVYVKLRRLKSRLALPPLRDVPRTREVVTYCACPNDEASIHAAQILLEAGFTRVRVLKGGWLSWRKSNGQVEPLSKVM